jgi:hypothetical protein
MAVWSVTGHYLGVFYVLFTGGIKVVYKLQCSEASNRIQGLLCALCWTLSVRRRLVPIQTSCSVFV